MILTKLFVWKIFKWTKISVFNWKTWKCRNKVLNDSKVFIECSNTMDNVYENIDYHNPTRKKKS